MREEIISILMSNMGKYVSGEKISEELGVTRAAVWKHVKMLKESGCDIHSVNNRGYRLNTLPDTLNERFLRILLEDGFSGCPIHYHKTIDSTNDEAKRLAAANSPDGTLVIAEEQTSGRGRLGRRWTSPYGKGIWMSLLLRPDVSPHDAQKLTIIGALAAAQAIIVQTGLGARIKWPNDIFVNGKKVCGILTEMSADIDHVHYVVMGIGVNVNVERADIPPEIADTATSLLIESGCPVSRLQLSAAICNRLRELIRMYLADYDFSPIAEEYMNYAILGPAEIRGPGVSLKGDVKGIDAQGALVVEVDGKYRRIISGEVSMKGAAV